MGENELLRQWFERLEDRLQSLQSTLQNDIRQMSQAVERLTVESKHTTQKTSELEKRITDLESKHANCKARLRTDSFGVVLRDLMLALALGTAGWPALKILLKGVLE